MEISTCSISGVVLLVLQLWQRQSFFSFYLLREKLNSKHPFKKRPNDPGRNCENKGFAGEIKGILKVLSHCVL